MKKIIFLVLAAFIIICLVLLLRQTFSSLYKQSSDTPVIITNFEECVAAGFAVMESYPARCRTDDGQTFTQKIVGAISTPDFSNEIEVVNPRPGQVVTSSLVVTGKARGSWFWETSFPIELRDANGKELGNAIATAQGEWMTEEFVQFHAEMIFSAPTTSEGKLILRNGNASGLPENAKEVTIPVTFTKNP